MAEQQELKLELKGLHTFPGTDTMAFDASLWINGKRACLVSNDGMCDVTEFNWLKGTEALEKAFNAYVKKQPRIVTDIVEPSGEPFSYPATAQTVVDDLYNKVMRHREELKWQRKLKAWSKKQTLFRVKGDKEGNWRTIREPYSAAIERFIKNKYGDTVECILDRNAQPVVLEHFKPIRPTPIDAKT